MKKSIKSLYNIVPFKRELFTLLRVLPIPHKLYQHLHFKGIINVKVEAKHQFKIQHYGYEIENDIFWKGLKGGWEKVSMDLWIKLSKKSDVILDIGANTGIYSLVSETLRPNAKIYAFEPVKRVFDKLANNIELNHFSAKPYEVAISNNDGEAHIYDTDSEHILSVTVNKNLLSPDTKARKVSINTLKLSTLIEREKLEKIDLIKIDVETHEAEVLEGMGKYLSKFKPTLLIEILNNEVANDVNRILEGLGYLYFDIDEIGLPKQVQQISRSSYYNYLVCQPSVAKELGLITE
jgi:FkbM family methyltransferase